MAIVVFQSVTDSCCWHIETESRTSSPYTTRYHVDVMDRGGLLIWAVMVPRDVSLSYGCSPDHCSLFLFFCLADNLCCLIFTYLLFYLGIFIVNIMLISTHVVIYVFMSVRQTCTFLFSELYLIFSSISLIINTR